MKLDFKALFRKPTNVQQATEKRDTAKLLMLGSLALALALTILGSILKLDILESLGMFAIVAAVIFFALWLSAKKEASRMQSIYCQCGERFVYPDDVIYEVIGEQISSGKQANSNKISRHTNTKVSIRCTCAKCANEQSFVTTFITKWEVLSERGVLLTTKDYPLEGLLKKHFTE